MRSERGSVVVLMTAAVVIAALCCLAAARLGRAATDRARADTAADAAALAAADVLAVGRSTGAAVSAARQVAAENGARLLTCACANGAAEVTVALGEARGRARAVVDP
jgi:Flp pilus assembly protein TadG